MLPLQKFSSYYFLHSPFVFIRFPFVFTRVHSCSIRVHSCSFVFHSCSTRVHSCSTRVHSCSTRVHSCSLVFTRVHSCSFVFTRVHSCSDLCGVLDMIQFTCLYRQVYASECMRHFCNQIGAARLFRQSNLTCSLTGSRTRLWSRVTRGSSPFARFVRSSCGRLFWLEHSLEPLIQGTSTAAFHEKISNHYSPN